MPIGAIRHWLGITPASAAPSEQGPLDALIHTLEDLEPAKARHLARFAYLLGRVAHADHQVTADETLAMEALVVSEGGLAPEHAAVVVALAKSTNQMFGGTADFQVAQEFAASTSYDEKLALARCLFRVATTDAAISMAEESEIHRIANHLKIEPKDLTALRLSHADYLPGLRSRGSS